MGLGGKRRIFIPAELAYGKKGYPPDILSDQDLVFEVELLSATGEGLQMPKAADLKFTGPAGPPLPAETEPATQGK